MRASGSNPKTPGEMVQELFDAILAGDPEALGALIHPDVTVVEPLGLPYGGVYEGKDAFFGKLLPAIMTHFELGIEDARIIEGTDCVAAQVVVVFTARGSGNVVRMPYVEVYDFEDGLIRRMNVYPQDTAGLAAFMETET